MKHYFIAHKLFLLFLAKFFLTYILLTVVYQLYLGGFQQNQIDGITQLVSQNTQQLMRVLDMDVLVLKDKGASVMVFYKQKYIARIIEGCNAISIIILFVSFIVAFSGKIKPTLLFICMGSLVIYGLNVVRIALLVVLLDAYPEQTAVWHGTIFPLFIYGVVFLLWVLWVTKILDYAKKTV
ncbi:exosortase family protein XrtF [Flavobacterium crassostreae]|uniref:Exosortase family protein XrtF n=1 Tax=Flavobacterium crassostreae TaxID=1763534 RepID=A0A1B9DXS4_9FLAO|nr:exosortase family protein XrtF [Flavobacterium crassostreae]OCB74485.1 exosortase family protein XrtF [Flavobacterium crassostreae]